MRNTLQRQKQKVKNQYPSCISLQADTNSRLNRTIAQSYPVLCHPAIFISVQADALHEKLHQKKYHLPESLTSPPNVPLPLKKFFNTSGNLYKELHMKERLPLMSEEEQLKLLSEHGMLIKRPLLVTEQVVLVGFKEENYTNLCSQS